MRESILNRLHGYVLEKSSQTTNMIDILLFTDARVSEIGGLWTEDVLLETEVPHIIIHEKLLKRLKTKASSHKVPLVGETLLAANAL
ncbi:hypothetical protein [Amphritea sp. HPY]|uniref:hypothetical protein n=1 Tax=Amphritea sp. HPY TaxID=3421652 RepID=UPI003D7E9E52